MYLLPEDAWTYELTGPCLTSGAIAGLAVVIPDTTPAGEQFTPADALHASVAATEEPLPWPVILRFIRFVEASGDILSAELITTVTGDLCLYLNSWSFANRIFEVTSYHDGEHDGWCYELYEVEPTTLQTTTSPYASPTSNQLADRSYRPPHGRSPSPGTAAQGFRGRSSGTSSMPSPPAATSSRIRKG